MSIEMPPNRLEAQRVALEVLEKKGIYQPPIVATRLLVDYGLTFTAMIFNSEHSKVAGFIDIKNNTIVVNAANSPQQQNFTIAHELGHFLLKHNERPDFANNYRVFLFETSSADQNAMEQEANFFADNLLVPLHLLKFYVNNFPDATDEQLAGTFGVPIDVLKRRKVFV